MLQAYNEMLKRGGRKQPDWFVAIEHSLKSLISKCNELFSCWLPSGRNADKQRYLSHTEMFCCSVQSLPRPMMQYTALHPSSQLPNIVLAIDQPYTDMV